VLCAFLLPVTSLVRGPDGVPLDDAVAAFKAIWANAQLGGAVYLSICSIAFFNFFGVSGKMGLLFYQVYQGIAHVCCCACPADCVLSFACLLLLQLFADNASWSKSVTEYLAYPTNRSTKNM
jgi:hypothetical protein